MSRFRLLNDFSSLLSKKLIIIQAPAGYGKTTVALDFAHQADYPICWLSLDELDVDFRRFVSHFIAAIQHKFPEFGMMAARSLQAQPTAQPTAQPIAQSTAETMVTAVINDLDAHIKEPFLLVLDDYHFIDDSDEVRQFINQFIRYADDNWHLCLLSRTQPAIEEIARLIMQGQVGGFSMENLAFQADEIQSLLHQTYHLDIDAATAVDLQEKTEGWVTGVLLSAQTDLQTGQSFAPIGQINIGDFLGEQVLARKSPQMRRILLFTALLGEFNADLCATILTPYFPSPPVAWTAVIHEIATQDSFLVPLDDKGHWLRYHHLFQEFFQAQAFANYPSESAAIYRQLAAHYMAAGDWQKAYSLYQQINDTAAIVNLIKQVGVTLLQRGDSRLLDKWITALPGDIRRTNHAIAMLYGAAKGENEAFDEAIMWLDHAEVTAKNAADSFYLAYTYAIRADTYRHKGNFDRAEQDALTALDIAPEQDAFMPIRATALRVMGIIYYRHGAYEAAIENLETAVALNKLLERDASVAFLQGGTLGMSYRAISAYDKALDAYKQALAYWEAMDDVGRQAAVRNNMGVLAHFLGDYEAALFHFEQAIACDQQYGNQFVTAVALVSIGDLYRDLDGLQAAQNAYQQAKEIITALQNRFMQQYIALAEATIARQQGNFLTAHDLLNQTRLLTNPDVAYEQHLRKLAMGQLALAEKQTEVAISHLMVAEIGFREAEQWNEAATAALYLAAAYQQANQPETAVATIAILLTITNQLNNRVFLLPAARECRDVLKEIKLPAPQKKQMQQFWHEVTGFETILPQLRRRLRRQATAVAFAPPRLIVKTLGQTEIIYNDTALTSADWTTQVARDLFLLLLHEPNGVSADVFGELFWPERTQKQMAGNVKKTLQRARGALQTEAIVLDRTTGLYRFNWEMDYDYDVENFTTPIKAAQQAASPNEQIAHYETAVARYTGDYLRDVDGNWVWERRESLRQTFIDAALLLATHYLEHHQYNQAIQCCERVLIVDPCDEAAHRLAMRSHAAKGNRGGVMRQYQLCQRVLQEDLEVEPSPQTTALYEQLIGDQ